MTAINMQGIVLPIGVVGIAAITIGPSCYNTAGEHVVYVPSGPQNVQTLLRRDIIASGGKNKGIVERVIIGINTCPSNVEKLVDCVVKR